MPITFPNTKKRSRHTKKRKKAKSASNIHRDLLDQSGLKWTYTSMIGAQPTWEREPDIEAIASVARSILNPDGGSLAVEFFAEGGFNKVYNVECSGKAYLMRVTLPVDPFHRTMSEVTTIRYLQGRTTIPVPRVIAYDASRDSAIGFEWILMEKIPGNQVDKIWHTLSWEAKVDLVRNVAEYTAQLSAIKFSAIGSLYPGEKALDVSNEILNDQLGLPDLPGQEPKAAKDTNFAIGRICSRPFFWGRNIKMDVPRGPFECSRDWMLAELLIHEKEAQEMIEGRQNDLDDSDYEEDPDEGIETWKMATRLRGLIYDFFPPEQDFLEQFVLKHGDMKLCNLLADDDGNITGLIDWEFVYTAPACYTARFPAFLSCPIDKSIFGTPREEDYMRKSNGEVQDCFYRDLFEFEMKALRPVFREHLTRLCPLWQYDTRDERTQKQADFVFAVKHLDSCSLVRLGEWLDAFEKSLKNGSKYVPLEEFF